MALAETFNYIFEPENKKKASTLFYLLGAGTTLIGGVYGGAQGHIPEGIMLVSGGVLSMALGFDYRMERIEKGMDKIAEEVGVLEEIN